MNWVLLLLTFFFFFMNWFLLSLLIIPEKTEATVNLLSRFAFNYLGGTWTVYKNAMP